MQNQQFSSSSTINPSGFYRSAQGTAASVKQFPTDSNTTLKSPFSLTSSGSLSTTFDTTFQGNVNVNGCINGSLCTPSDVRLKHNILTIKDEVLSPAQVQSVSFQNDNIVQCINELILLAQNKNI
jgi:hypothetical protein